MIFYKKDKSLKVKDLREVKRSGKCNENGNGIKRKNKMKDFQESAFIIGAMICIMGIIGLRVLAYIYA